MTDFSNSPSVGKTTGAQYDPHGITTYGGVSPTALRADDLYANLDDLLEQANAVDAHDVDSENAGDINLEIAKAKKALSAAKELRADELTGAAE